MSSDGGINFNEKVGEANINTGDGTQVTGDGANVNQGEGTLNVGGQTFGANQNPDIQLANDLEQVWKESIDGNEPRAIPEPPAPEGAVASSEPQEINFEELNTGGELFGAMRKMAETEPEPEQVKGFWSRVVTVAKERGPKMLEKLLEGAVELAGQTKLGTIGKTGVSMMKAAMGGE